MNRQQHRAAAEGAKSSKPSPTTLLETGARYLQSGQFAEAENAAAKFWLTIPIMRTRFICSA